MSKHLVLFEMSCKLCNEVVGWGEDQVSLGQPSARHAQTHHPEILPEIMARDDATIEKYFKLEQLDLLSVNSILGKADA